MLFLGEARRFLYMRQATWRSCIWKVSRGMGGTLAARGGAARPPLSFSLRSASKKRGGIPLRIPFGGIQARDGYRHLLVSEIAPNREHSRLSIRGPLPEGITCRNAGMKIDMRSDFIALCSLYKL